MRPLFLALLVACGTTPEPAPAPAPAPVAPAPVPEPAAAPAPAGDVAPGDPEAGEAIYTTNCVACHQADGTGMGGMLAADFTKEKERLARPEAEILASIRDGIVGKKGTMPGWKGTLSEQEMADALAYIKRSFGS